MNIQHNRILIFILIFSIIIPINIYAENRNQNIIVIVIDCLRADRLSCYGYAKNTSPAIDALAAEGILFNRAVAPGSNTLLSFASLFTSLYPLRHGVTAFNKCLSDTTLTFPEIFQKYGFKTAFFGGGPLLDKIYGLSRGFDLYEYSQNASFNDSLPAALKWIRQNYYTNQNFFAIIHGNDLHVPYSYPDETGFSDSYKNIFKNLTLSGSDFARLYNKIIYDDSNAIKYKLNNKEVSYLSDKYDQGITYIDRRTGEFIEQLKKDNILGNTVLVITADHGEGLFDHKWFYHDYILYDSVTHVPLIIKFPMGVFEPAVIYNDINLIDLLPTLLESAGGVVPDKIDGNSFFGALKDTSLFNNNYSLSATPFSTGFTTTPIFSASTDFLVIRYSLSPGEFTTMRRARA